jgi:hypothetical protein
MPGTVLINNSLYKLITTTHARIIKTIEAPCLIRRLLTDEIDIGVDLQTYQIEVKRKNKRKKGGAIKSAASMIAIRDSS